MNPYLQLIEAFSENEKTNRSIISKNPNTPIEWILERPEWNDVKSLSSNPNLRIHHLLQYPDLSWEWKDVSQNQGISLRDILRHPDLSWDWKTVSANPSITQLDIESYPNLPWYWENLSKNPNLTLDFIERNLDKPWTWRYLSFNPHLTIDFIKKYSKKDWSWVVLTDNLSISLDNIYQTPELHWDMPSLLHRSDITYTYLNKNRLLYRYWHNMIKRYNLFLDLSDISDIPYWILSYTDCFDIDIVRKYLQSGKPLATTQSFMSLISSSAFLTPDMIEDNLDLPWDWKSIIVNPNLTIEFYQRHKTQFPVRTTYIKFCANHLQYHCGLNQKRLERESKERIQERCERFRLELICKTWDATTPRGRWLVMDRKDFLMSF